jgi:hypothetical protein
MKVMKVMKKSWNKKRQIFSQLLSVDDNSNFLFNVVIIIIRIFIIYLML